MKIVAVGKNYVNELSEMPSEKVLPIVFTKPDTTLLENNEDLVLPSFSNDVWFEAELAFRIGKKCKAATAENALDFIDAVTLSNDLTAKDVLASSRETKGPWALAKGFDGATPIAPFYPIADFPDVTAINFSYEVNGVEVQRGNSSHMITNLVDFVVYVSSIMTLNPGDILLTGTPPKGVGKVNSGDVMIGYLEGKKVLETKVK
ncbi:fumarylacetoacetate hydrolase family protein [Cellulophaga baltica]|uniref:2-keto-4-pentenoate hydratase/2-oxohepta-3-ene-1,7-dioic acid hydratase (Catechol pathway) n=1 Tax=Cellulophaga baltica TaxID=76594 RepID=A0A1G7KLC4_9FLAO|nr:fumarylacetoacetate hydrolase family protein [Cellulophaga baltica]MCR1026575.1 fumarylacetoacetate hydrolase family protein [Cellulophaga baltica]WFO17889.1 fumarylacetoacetate hydrolase family protein [Cellulophaga baltica 4]SDF38012.1 2-keto-4-pentenoate hydratase/2-oxohepta-3-ene-1,7-dioic acid hydratase (catechol pathway) [Cellulophaga baltica]